MMRRTSKRRVLRVTREHGLQAPHRVDEMWGTDMTTTLTGEGNAVFVLVDHGSRFVAVGVQHELDFLGLEGSPAFVREPEGNGCAECSIRVLKENLSWVRHFDTVEDLRRALNAFKDAYNRRWILQRHGYRTPARVRADQTAPPIAA